MPPEKQASRPNHAQSALGKQSTLKGSEKTSDEAGESCLDPLKVLENEIGVVAGTCRLFLKEIKNGKDAARVGTEGGVGPKKGFDSFEKVTNDISNILDTLEYLNSVNKPKDSYSDVLPSLEEKYRKQIEKLNDIKKANEVNTKKQTGASNATKTGNVDSKLSSRKSQDTKTDINKPKKPPLQPARSTGVKNAAEPASNKARMNARTSKNSMGGKKSSVKSVTSSNARRPVEPNRVNLNQQFLNNNPMVTLKQEVDKAIQERKTFTVRGYFRSIRKALLSRGWVEKIYITQRELMNTELRKFCNYSVPELLALIRNKELADICKKLIKSKMLANHQVDFYYSSNYDGYKECPDKIKQTMINRIRWTSFSYTNKGGLTEASQKSFWYHIPGVANLNHPRSYKLTKNGDTEEFVKDYNLTAAMSLIKWVKLNSETQLSKVMSPSGKIPLRVFDFAVNECYKFIKKAKHDDIDQDIQEAQSHEWSEFLEYFYKTVHTGNHFKLDNNVSEGDLVRKASFILEKLKQHWPFLDMDGLMNIWILKPMNSSQGVGIHMCRTLKYVLQTIKANENRRYVIQKYIERPLLIYHTKFDIRQWFLISSCAPLTIWIYKHCYLRFSSQTYNLRKLHESIHLTNNSVQSKYNRVSTKDISLPSYNMWDSNHFKNYLSDIGYPKAFAEMIYPGMKESITAAVLMHQDSIDRRAASFELYGADFMLTEDFKPWLLEINSNPALQASTPITARMCPIVLEDVVRVLVDYKNDKKASTGGFELLYLEQASPRKRAGELAVAGTPLKLEFFSTPVEILEKSCSIPESPQNKAIEQVSGMKDLGKSIRQILQNLLDLLRQEKLKKSKRKHVGVDTILLSTNKIDTESVETLLDTMNY